MAKITKTSITREEFFALAVECATLELEKNKLKARLDLSVMKIKKSLGDKMEECEKRMKAILKLCEPYAVMHAQELFGPERKSAKNEKIKFGFRTDTPSVKTVGRRKDAEACEILRNSEGGLAYVSVKYALDKSKIGEALKNAQNMPSGIGNCPENLSETSSVPLKMLYELFELEQKEKFFIEPNTDKNTENTIGG